MTKGEKAFINLLFRTMLVLNFGLFLCLNKSSTLKDVQQTRSLKENIFHINRV